MPYELKGQEPSKSFGNEDLRGDINKLWLAVINLEDKTDTQAIRQMEIVKVLQGLTQDDTNQLKMIKDLIESGQATSKILGEVGGQIAEILDTVNALK